MSIIGNMTGNKAYTAHRKGEYQTALKLYKEAYEKGMDKPQLLRTFSILLIRMQEYDLALEILKKLEKTPKLAPKDKLEMHINYAVILSQKGRLDRAIEILEDEFRHVKNGTLYGTLGYLLIEQGDAQKALSFNQEALEYDDTDPVFLDNLAQTYYRLLSDKETAKTYFDRAYACKPTAIDTNYFLAMYAMEAGDKEKAKEHLKTSMEGFFSPLNFATPQKIEEQLAKLNA